MARRKRKHLPQVEKEPEAIFTPQEEKELTELLAVIKYPPYELRRVSNGTFGGSTWKWVPTDDPMPLWWDVIIVLGNLLGGSFNPCGHFLFFFRFHQLI